MERKTLFKVKRRKHWDNVYASKSPTEVSWYQARLTVSLELIKLAGITRYARILDVGGGASTLVDDLLQEGFQDITVLDLAAAALATASTGLIWTRISVLRGCCLARSRQKVPPRSSGGNKSASKPPDLQLQRARNSHRPARPYLSSH